MAKVRKLKFIDLFAGIGGFRLALDSLGMECVFSSEWDKFAQETYQANFGHLPEGDITVIPAKSIPPHDVICGGFPCQAFSISGKQKGFGDARGTLFFDILRIARQHKPRLLILENVENFARHDGGRTLETVVEMLKKAGYSVYFEVLNASHFGVPTARKRIFFVAFRKDLKISSFEFPKSYGEPVSLRGFLEDDRLTEKYVIRRTDIVLKPKQVGPDVFGNYPQTPIQIGIINKGGQGERIYHDLGHAVTLSAYGGGAASKTGAYLVNGKIRKLSPRECARIMGFPEDFVIPVSDSQAFKQFGNSVAVPVVAAVAKAALTAMGEKVDASQSPHRDWFENRKKWI